MITVIASIFLILALRLWKSSRPSGKFSVKTTIKAMTTFGTMGSETLESG